MTASEKLYRDYEDMATLWNDFVTRLYQQLDAVQEHEKELADELALRVLREQAHRCSQELSLLRYTLDANAWLRHLTKNRV